MSTRVGYWLCGLAVGFGLRQFVPDESCGLSESVFFMGLISMGLLGEIVAQIRAWRTVAPETPPDATPADGRVEIVPIAGVRGKPNACDGRFRRFVAIEPGEWPTRARSRSARHLFPPLLGRVAIGPLFLDRDGKGWSDKEIARAMDCVIRAGEWIEKEAIRLGAAVNLVVPDVYFVAEDPVPLREVELEILPEGDGEGLFDAGAETRLVAAASRGASSLGFADVADLAATIGGRVRSDGFVWLIQPRSAGRSFVVPESDTGILGVSLAICYAREDDFPGPLHGPPFSDPATVAHEILHLFGATDKYGVPLSSFSPELVSERDVMRLDYSALSRLRIDPATAAEIGWGEARK